MQHTTDTSLPSTRKAKSSPKPDTAKETAAEGQPAIPSSPTCPNHLLNFDTRDIDFFCKFPDSLIGIFVGERININLHPWSHCIKVRERVRQTDANGMTDAVIEEKRNLLV